MALGPEQNAQGGFPQQEHLPNQVAELGGCPVSFLVLFISSMQSVFHSPVPKLCCLPSVPPFFFLPMSSP
jgi:hypothetical protein